MSELEESIPDRDNTEEIVDYHLLSETISRFLRTLPEEAMAVFVSRYYYSDSVKDIARNLKISESKVKSTLFRIRKKLKSYLEKEGYAL